MSVKGLVAPAKGAIDIVPSPEQWQMYKYLLPNRCPECGGEIEHVKTGTDAHGNEQFKPQCKNCGTQRLPQIILGGGSAGGGKMLPFGSKICTPTGFKLLENIKVGDFIANPINGGAQEVVWLHPIETHEFYRIHFIDGTHIDCSEGHLWNVHEAGKTTKRRGDNGSHLNERVKPTKWMYEWMLKKEQGSYKGRHLIIPLTAPVRFAICSEKFRRDIIEPYVLGALIGDGYLHPRRPTLTTMDQEIVDKFIEFGYDMSDVQRNCNKKSSDYVLHSDKINKALERFGLANHTAKDKFIPELYKYATVQERIELMQGLMDTDGYVDDRGHMSYSTISEQLANDVAFIVRSLGGVATIKRNKAGYKDKDGVFKQCNDAYDVYIRTKINTQLVCLSRKHKRTRDDFNGGASELGKRIIKIEPIGKKTGRCITVDDPSGLYVVDDFTVTHNSYLGSAWIVSSCMMFPDIRAIVARKTIKSLKDSTFNTIKMILRKWNLEELKNYKINNLEGTVTFWNGSQILLRELDDLPSDSQFERLGSMEATIGFVDEVSEISQKAIEVLFSRLRWNTHYFGYPRLLLTTNPCTTWVRSTFVQDDQGNPVNLPEHLAYIPFSVYSNPDKAFVRTYEASLQKISDKALRARLLYGNWDYVDANEIACYWKFDGEKHLKDNLKESVYDPTKPLILSLDFNTVPFMSAIAVQIDWERKCIYVLEEILGKPEDKENNTPKFSQKIKAKYLTEGHIGGLFITGDPAGLQRSTQTEDGVNNYTIALSNLSDPILRPQKKLLSRQPSQITRLEFVNSLLDGYDGWSIQIDMRCRKLTEDLLYQKKNADGSKSKAKITDPKLGVKYERYGHLSDCLDYFLCLFLKTSFSNFNRRDNGVTTYNGSPIYGLFDY